MDASLQSAASQLQHVHRLCDAEECGETTSVALHDRLQIALDRLLGSSSKSASRQTIAAFSAAVATLERHLAHLHDASLVERLLAHAWFWSAVRSIGEDVDGLYSALGLDPAAWEDAWEKDRLSTVLRLEEQLKDEGTLHENVQGSEKARDARMLLSAEAANIKASQSTLREESKLAVEKAKAILSRLYWTTDFGVPPWFNSPAELVIESRPAHSIPSDLVYRGRLRGDTAVAVKMVNLEDKNTGLPSNDLKKAMLLQVDVLRRLHHPNIVRFIGACHASARPFIVGELAARGTLAEYIAATQPGRKMIWRLFCDAARGLGYLHDWGFVCGDLTLQKLLVGADEHVRVSIFGLQRFPAASTINKPPGSPSVAPEYLDGTLTPSSDVYSLGMLLIGVLGGEALGDLDTQSDTQFERKIGQGELPTRPFGFADNEWSLVEAMTAWGPSERVGLGEVIEELHELAGQ